MAGPSNTRIASAASTLLLVLVAFLLLTTRATATALRRQQQSKARAAREAAHPSGPSMNRAPFTAITPRAAREMLQYALLFELDGGVATGLLVRTSVVYRSNDQDGQPAAPGFIRHCLDASVQSAIHPDRPTCVRT